MNTAYQASRAGRRRAVAMLLCCALLGAVSWAVAQTPFKVNIPNVAPWVLHEPGQGAGIHVDLLGQLSRQARLPLEVVPIVYVRMAEGLKMGLADLAVGVDSPQLNDAGIKVGLFLSVRTIVVGRRGATLSSRDDLRGKTLGIVRGTWYDERIAADGSITKHPVADIHQGVRMVAAGRIDCVIGTDRALTYSIAHSGKPRDAFSAPLDIGGLDFALFARKGLQPEIIQRLRDALVIVDKSAEKRAILARY